MKQFLVPALLLSLVGVAVAIGAGSAPAPSPAVSGECHKFSMGFSGHCPMSSGECKELMGGEACPEAAAERCTESGESADCMQKCEEKQDLDCCKKKVECGKCPKTEPAEKP